MTDLGTPGPFMVSIVCPSGEFRSSKLHVGVVNPSGVIVAVTGAAGPDAPNLAQSMADAKKLAAAPSLQRTLADLVEEIEADPELAKRFRNELTHARWALHAYGIGRWGVPV